MSALLVGVALVPPADEFCTFGEPKLANPRPTLRSCPPSIRLTCAVIGSPTQPRQRSTLDGNAERSGTILHLSMRRRRQVSNKGAQLARTSLERQLHGHKIQF